MLAIAGDERQCLDVCLVSCEGEKSRIYEFYDFNLYICEVCIEKYDHRIVWLNTWPHDIELLGSRVLLEEVH